MKILQSICTKCTGETEIMYGADNKTLVNNQNLKCIHCGEPIIIRDTQYEAETAAKETDFYKDNSHSKIIQAAIVTAFRMGAMHATSIANTPAPSVNIEIDEIKKREYNRGYVDCAKKYQNNAPTGQ